MHAGFTKRYIQHGQNQDPTLHDEVSEYFKSLRQAKQEKIEKKIEKEIEEEINKSKDNLKKIKEIMENLDKMKDYGNRDRFLSPSTIN
jgi:hypothetical protein